MMMMLKRKAIAAANARRRNAVEIAEAIDFDGANDYLSRSSDLVGNADGKTFTFSAWVWTTENTSVVYIGRDEASTNNGLLFRTNGDKFRVGAYDASGLTRLFADLPTTPVACFTFFHVLISIDLTSTAKRHAYINDVDVTSSTTWSTYVDAVIDFTKPSHYIAATIGPTADFKGRLAHVYLDHTYRDLSIEANRRLFITDDLKPVAKADVAALNPILYLPLDDPTAPGLNLGTGGDFALNGVVARSGRGPNQYNVAYSDLDGAADYLSRTTAPVGIADGKQFTLHYNFTVDSFTATNYVADFQNTAGASRFTHFINGAGGANMSARDSAGTIIFGASLPAGTFVAGRNYTVDVSIDLSDTTKRQIMVNGATVAATWSTYTNSNIDFTVAYGYFIGNAGTTSYFNGKLGDVWFDTTYIDLSANNPFWDSKTNKPAFLGVNGEVPTGLPPLVYLPMRADNAGKNMGTGGDFTVNSGPFTGARGPSEFWAGCADFDGTTGCLSRSSALVGASGTSKFSIAAAVRLDTNTTADYILSLAGEKLQMFSSSTAGLGLKAYNSAGNIILNTNVQSFFPAGSWVTLLAGVDLADTAKRYIYKDGTLQTVTWVAYTNDNIDLSLAGNAIGALNSPLANWLDGKIGFLWFSPEYIDFSQEANRLKFFDAFGYPVDLGADGSLPTGNVPLIYMHQDMHLGNNLGSGGVFTVNGTVADGGHVKG